MRGRAPRSALRRAVAAALALLAGSVAIVDAFAESALRLRPPASLETGLARVYDSDGVPVGHSRIEFAPVAGRLHIEVNTVLESGEHSEFAMGLEPVGDGHMKPVWQRTRSYDAHGELAVEALVDHARARATCRHDGDLRVVELPLRDRVANVPLDLVLDPLAGGSVDEVRFQFLYCRGVARIFEASARRRAVLEPLAGYGAVAEIEVDFDLGPIFSVVLKPFLPRIKLWMNQESPARWLGHRMPLVPRGPTLLVLREGVAPALFQRRK